MTKEEAETFIEELFLDSPLLLSDPVLVEETKRIMIDLLISKEPV